MNRTVEIAALTVIFIASFLFDKWISASVIFLHNPFMDIIMRWITNLGSVIVVLLLMTSLFLWEERKRKWIIVLLLCGVVAVGVGNLIKFMVGRPRPVIPPGLFPGSSFPSGHTAIAFATLPVLDREFPKLKTFWLVFIILVGFSRLYFNYHFLSDVVGGALLGYIIGHYFVIEEETRGIFGKFSRRVFKWM